MPEGTRARRILLYARAAYGFGQLRRLFTLGAGLRRRWPSMVQLLVTGSPCPQHLSFPDGLDYVKLPSVEQIGPNAFASPWPAFPLDALQVLRGELVRTVVHHFEPDVLLVDSFPQDPEILLTLRELKRTGARTRLVLGLRDVIGDAATVRGVWAGTGVYEALDSVFDRILVFGERDFYDVAREYAFSPEATIKTRHTGYLRREVDTRSPAQVRAQMGLSTGRLVLVTAGAGRGGFPLLRTMLDALRDAKDSEFDCLLVSGPMMAAAERRELARCAPPGSRARLVEFLDDMASHVAAADVVVSTAGNSTVSEILSFGRPALLVPRTRPTKEQLIRAEILSGRGLVRMLHPVDLTPARLLHEITRLLHDPPRSQGLALDGVPAAVAELEAIWSDIAE